VNKNDRMWTKNVAIIVAHPDDETLWAGGTILNHPSWKCFIICMCRKNDPDRAPRFYKALHVLKSQGNMSDLDDGPEQSPLVGEKVEQAILDMLPTKQFDLIISHNPSGEYTKNLRHEKLALQLLTSGMQAKYPPTNYGHLLMKMATGAICPDLCQKQPFTRSLRSNNT
jgi:hypothetical protein